MFRLIKDWSKGGITIYAGVSLKEKPASGILSEIPDEYLEEYELVKKSKPKQKPKTQSPPKEDKTVAQNARIGDSKIF